MVFKTSKRLETMIPEKQVKAFCCYWYMTWYHWRRSIDDRLPKNYVVDMEKPGDIEGKPVTWPMKNMRETMTCYQATTMPGDAWPWNCSVLVKNGMVEAVTSMAKAMMNEERHRRQYWYDGGRLKETDELLMIMTGILMTVWLPCSMMMNSDGSDSGEYSTVLAIVLWWAMKNDIMENQARVVMEITVRLKAEIMPDDENWCVTWSNAKTSNDDKTTVLLNNVLKRGWQVGEESIYMEKLTTCSTLIVK